MENNTENNMAENLFAVFRQIHSILPQSDQDLHKNLTRSHYEVLFVIYDNKKIPMSEIAKLLSLSKPYMTALIGRLIEETLVERVPDQKDRRIIDIILTTKGEKLLLQHKKMIEQHINQKFAHFESNDLEYLSVILKNLKEMFMQIDL
ncbi:MAG: hypothetical protein CVV02_10450 [Firmicutes bacterium HGW-Firmicutes-7]|nr:MAG: hypothetical protein CVV02_10450 [Firmicutes bacterium HGW-Firmicutes-7]